MPHRPTNAPPSTVGGTRKNGKSVGGFAKPNKQNLCAMFLLAKPCCFNDLAIFWCGAVRAPGGFLRSYGGTFTMRRRTMHPFQSHVNQIRQSMRNSTSALLNPDPRTM